MSEQIAYADQQAMNHFISDSPWDAQAVMGQVAQDVDAAFSKGKGKKGLLIDESGWKKSGKHSVGVARQYLGNIGKTDNGQVGVFLALTQADKVALVQGRLYLPQVWTNNPTRCAKAKIPPEAQNHKTKPQLALQMIHQLADTISYDWIGGDSVYGNSPTLRHSLHQMGKLYVLDAREDLQVYLQDPALYIGEQAPPQQTYNKDGSRRKKMGPAKCRYTTDQQPVTLQELRMSSREEEWTTLKLRKGTKGWLKRKALIKSVYLWQGQRVNNPHVEKLRVVISQDMNGENIKYTLINDWDNPLHEQHSLQDVVYMQMQRHFVEKSFRDIKQQLGFADYQVRTWRAWYHHIALTLLALLYILEQQIIHQEDVPLLSANDIKYLLANSLQKKAQSQEELQNIIWQRHKVRQMDINRYYH
jgi:SRSO17 transposase